VVFFLGAVPLGAGVPIVALIGVLLWFRQWANSRSAGSTGNGAWRQRLDYLAMEELLVFPLPFFAIGLYEKRLDEWRIIAYTLSAIVMVGLCLTYRQGAWKATFRGIAATASLTGLLYSGYWWEAIRLFETARTQYASAGLLLLVLVFVLYLPSLWWRLSTGPVEQYRHS